MLWARYQHSLVKKAAREHIVSVQHAKTQNSIGMGCLDLGLGYTQLFVFQQYSTFSSLPKKILYHHPVCHLHCARLVEKYMEKVCSVNLLQDMVNVPNVDAWLKQAAIEQKVGVSTFTKCVYFKKYLYNENTGPGLIIFVSQGFC